MATPPIARIEGLREFTAAVRKAKGAAPREITKALKASGEMLPGKIRPGMGSVSANVGRPTATQRKARIKVIHRASAIAEFSNKGRYAQTMNAKYGRTPRYGYRAVDDSQEEITRKLQEGFSDIIEIYGWAKE